MEFLHMVYVAAHLLLNLQGVPQSQHADFMACWYVPANVVSVERAACDVEVQDDAAGQEFMRAWADNQGKLHISAVAPSWED